jgi:hypothetical protein
MGSRLSAGGVEAAQSGADEVDPGRGGGEVQEASASGGGEASGHREQPQAQPFGLSAAGRMIGLRPGLLSGEYVGGQRHDGAPGLVPREVAQRQVRQAAVCGGADAVLGAGPAAVAQLEVGQLTTGRVGDKRSFQLPACPEMGRPRLCGRVTPSWPRNPEWPGPGHGLCEVGDGALTCRSVC